MLNLFGRSNRDGRRQGEPEKDDLVLTARQQSNPIAEIEAVGQTLVATLTITEITDEQGAGLLADLLDDLAAVGARHYVLDISNVQFMNSACLGCLVQALNTMARADGKIALVNPANSVQSLFRLTRLDSVFVVCHDVVTALQKLEGNPLDDDD